MTVLRVGRQIRNKTISKFKINCLSRGLRLDYNDGLYKNITQQEYSCASLLRVHNHKLTRAKGFEERFSHRRYISTSLMQQSTHLVSSCASFLPSFYFLNFRKNSQSRAKGART